MRDHRARRQRRFNRLGLFVVRPAAPAASAGNDLDASHRRRLRVKRKIKSRHKPIPKSRNQTRACRSKFEGGARTALTKLLHRRAGGIGLEPRLFPYPFCAFARDRALGQFVAELNFKLGTIKPFFPAVGFDYHSLTALVGRFLPRLGRRLPLAVFFCLIEAYRQSQALSGPIQRESWEQSRTYENFRLRPEPFP